ncbi:MAG: AAA family ATPase [Caldivirga sp.]
MKLLNMIKLSLENIGPLKKAEIKVDNGPIILYGPNNAGKTTII